MDEIGRLGIILLLGLVRLFVLFRTLPVMGTGVIPPQALTAFAGVLLLPFFPVLEEGAPATIGLSLFTLGIIGKEIFLGLVMGFAFSLVFWVAHGVGSLIDNQRGAAQAEGMEPLSGEQATPFASFFFQSLAMLFFSSGIFLTILDVIFQSYAVWPLFSPLPRLASPHMAQLMLDLFSRYMAAVLAIAGPMVALCFLSDFCLGLLNRFAPQLNVFSLSMPIKSGLVLFILILYVGDMLTELDRNVRGIGSLFRVLQNMLS